MKDMICKHCGAGIRWDGMSKTVKCGFCGAEYIMHPEAEGGGQLPVRGNGTVVPMTIYGDDFIKDRPIIKSYVPAGWRIATGQADRIDMMGNPLVPEIRLTSPDDSAFIFFRGLSRYRHIEPAAMNRRLQGQLDFGPINPMNPSYFRLKSFMTADECLDALVNENCRIQNLRTVSENTEDEKEMERQRRIIEAGRQAGFSEVHPKWLRRISKGINAKGVPVMAVAETRVVLSIRSQMAQGVQNPGTRAGSFLNGFMGGILNMMGGFSGSSPEFKVWETQYELLGISQEKDFEGLMEEFEKVDQSVDYLPAMQQIIAQMNAFIENEKMRAGNAVSNAQLNMAQENMASMERRSAIIADTNAYTGNIQQQMIADNAASHSRVANLNSEMIREVNTYRGSDGVVEASARYDHVYQHRTDPDTYAAQEGDYYEPGVDFSELKRTKGDY
ncbi:MAG: hypothetical protein K5770_04775 [Lachnospiraceae bacterium]|nr:hypothetical protein [Lachnospiraceae bacterium]